MTEPLVIPIKLFVPHAVIPTKAYSSDACYDVSASENVFIPPMKTEKVKLGFGLQLPPGWEAQIRPRSGLNAKGILALFGTVDANYRGEVCAVIFNASSVPFWVEPGTRVAQMAIRPIYDAVFETTAELEESDRGAGGFGSTGLAAKGG
jgi:dUTP pyrophosphatase